MNYEPLAKLYYKDKSVYTKIYNERFNNEFSYHLPFEISGNKAFFIIDYQISRKIEEIYYISRQLDDILNQLPPIAFKYYINKNLIDEIMLTNDIEGVYSTRKEISQIIEMPDNSTKKVRLMGLVKKYQKLINGEKIPFSSCNDIRLLFDEIVLNEIEEDEKPDGEIFRTGSVSVCTATDKEKHRGLYPEKKLIDFLNKSLDFLTNENNVGPLVKIAVFHYLFGYAHPFYNGNGRTSRFISSYLLCNILNQSIALRISYTIKNDKNKYYKAFDICNDSKNKGDITPFIYSFIDIIKNAAKSSLENLESLKQRLEYYSTIHENIYNFFENDLQSKIVYILIQNALFSSKGVFIEELKHHLECSEATIRKNIKSLIKHGLIITTEREKNKMLYELSLDDFEQFAENIQQL
ncbi:MAG: Fic family protein [Pseudoruminococcus massiliensis]|jgi:Fic family protein|uniref:Fic family protein n=1 Tax=Pseudoruminococcus massiliensis TaxID=2086583 RepID=UPI00399105C5